MAACWKGISCYKNRSRSRTRKSRNWIRGSRSLHFCVRTVKIATLMVGSVRTCPHSTSLLAVTDLEAQISSRMLTDEGDNFNPAYWNKTKENGMMTPNAYEGMHFIGEILLLSSWLFTRILFPLSFLGDEYAQLHLAQQNAATSHGSSSQSPDHKFLWHSILEKKNIHAASVATRWTQSCRQ